MLVGRLRDIRAAKGLTQDDIGLIVGVFRPYICHVENGHTVPGIETLEKWAHALGMQLYQVLYEGEQPPEPLKPPTKGREKLWGNSGHEARDLDRLRRSLAKMWESDRKIALALVDSYGAGEVSGLKVPAITGGLEP